ncbi:hypothetical protein [Caulobacter sp. CCH9-E1]|uniref:hypothetical protein n=1 Tax=Caulobacter sp. CCH9-E1 TaxID=1768768 RepID=UPI000829A411|nr:hypothetical protein [Caulobacter sp. CCH9-E1]
MALTGGWYWASAGDREVLSKLVGLDQAALEVSIKTLSIMEDAPLFSIAEAGGIISRPDAFTALRGVLTAGDVERFVEVAFDVLSLPDPAIDLPPDQRWYANVVGKDRPHSGRLRTNLADSLAFLAAASEGLVGGPAARWAVERLVHRLFQVEDPSIWFHTRDVLPALAEAAPDAFMRALERDLDREADDVGVWRLLKPVEGTSGENLRAGLLWGLERIAWSPDRFGHVATILAGLCARALSDNWVNKPASTLAMLFHPLLPQTGADEALQMRVLEAIFRRYGANRRGMRSTLQPAQRMETLPQRFSFRVTLRWLFSASLRESVACSHIERLPSRNLSDS